MNEQAKVNAGNFKIADNEQCVWCDADRSHLQHTGQSDEWMMGMRCQMIHCDVCDNEFGCSCDIIMEDGTLLHDHDEAYIAEFWGEPTDA